MHKPLLLSLLISLTATLALDGWAAHATPAATRLTNEHGGSWLAATAGAASLVIDPEWRTEGDANGEQYGQSVTGAGDVDGDGYSDVLIGAPVRNENGYKTGGALLYLGSMDGLGDTPNWSVGGNSSGDRFGAAVSALGYFNDDSYADVIVGAPEYKTNTKVGATYVFYGTGVISDALRLAEGWPVEGAQQDSRFGWAVAGAGDVDGDGCDDALVGAPDYKDSFIGEGAVFLYYGCSDTLNSVTNLTADWSFFGGQTGASLGSAVSPAGDVNDDGYADFMVSAPSAGEQGVVYLFLGSNSGPQEEYITLTGNKYTSGFGRAISQAGDVNDDGYSDILISARYSEENGSNYGWVHIYFGSPTGISPTANGIISGQENQSQFGSSLAVLGDLNGDNLAEFAIGDPYYSNDQPEEGGVFIYQGRPTWPKDDYQVKPDWVGYGNKAETLFGTALSSAVDIDSDSCLDLIVGAPAYRSGEIILGAAFLFDICTTHTVHLPMIQR